MYEKPVLGGIGYDKVKRNISGNVANVEDEFDIVMYNDDSISIIGCKTIVHENDLIKLIEKKPTTLGRFSHFIQIIKFIWGLLVFHFMMS